MAENTKFAVHVHRKGEKPTTILRDTEGGGKAAVKNVAEDLDLKIDDDGKVIGDDEITHLTVEPAPDTQYHHEVVDDK